MNRALTSLLPRSQPGERDIILRSRRVLMTQAGNLAMSDTAQPFATDARGDERDRPER
jgi:hypothetical protein